MARRLVPLPPLRSLWSLPSPPPCSPDQLPIAVNCAPPSISWSDGISNPGVRSGAGEVPSLWTVNQQSFASIYFLIVWNWKNERHKNPENNTMRAWSAAAFAVVLALGLALSTEARPVLFKGFNCTWWEGGNTYLLVCVHVPIPCLWRTGGLFLRTEIAADVMKRCQAWAVARTERSFGQARRAILIFFLVFI